MISWIIFALISAICAALVAVFGKIGLANVDTTLAAAVRAVIMAALLFFTALSLGKFELIKTIDGKAFLFIALSGIAGALSWLAYFFALKFGPASSVAAIDRLSVVFVLVFAMMFLGEGFSRLAVLGAALITAGAVLMTLR